MAKGAKELEDEVRSLLSTCSGAARGLWHEMRHLIETFSDRPGHLQRNGRPTSDVQLALAAGFASDEVARLLQELDDVGLIARADRCWSSGRLAALAVRREKRRELTREWRATGGEGRAVRLRDRKAKAGERVSRDTVCDQSVTSAQPVDPPPQGSFPLTLSLSPNPTTLPFSSKTGDGDADASTPADGAASPNRSAAPKRAARSGAKLSETEHAVRVAFGDWWRLEAYPQAMQGVEYAFDGGRDAPAVLKILRSPWVKWDLARAQQLATTFLTADDTYIANQGRPLHTLAGQLHRWVQITIAKERGSHVRSNQHQRAAASQHQQPRRQLPSLNSRASSGAGSLPRAG